MTDIEEKNTDIPVNPEAVSSSPATQITAESTDMLNVAVEGALKERLQSRKKSIGESVYDRTVYTGIGFGANELFSLLFTGMFERGKNGFLGKARFDQISKWMTTKYKFKSGQEGARNLLMWASLNFIGCFVVPAIKITDNYKPRIIKWLNHRFGSKGMNEADIAARDREVDEAVACEPTQSWGTLWMGRIAAMGVAIGLGHGILGDPGNKKLKSSFDTGASNVASAIGLKKYTAGSRTLPNHELSRFHYYSQLAGPETLGSGTTSVVLEIASKFFAKHWPRFKDPKVRAEALEKEKEKLTAAFAARTDGDASTSPRDTKIFAAEKPAASYAKKIASEPQPTLQASI